jgi:hypothetical protein
VSTVTPEQREILAKLASIAEMIEQQKSTIAMLVRERMRLTTQLRLSGWRPREQSE